MSDFEVAVFIGSLFFTLKAWGIWFTDLVCIHRFHCRVQHRVLLFAEPLLCLALISYAVVKLAAPAVRTDGLYIAFYLLLGAAWVGATTLVFPLFGVSARDDVLERGNSAALCPVGGALIGVSCCFAGANIGDGPGVEVVLFSAALSLTLFFGLWLAVERLTSFSEEITVERNTGAGIRLGGLLVGLGILCGWSVAGNWVSVLATIQDLAVFSWAAIVLGLAGVVVEQVFSKPEVRGGAAVIPSIAVTATYVVAAVAWVVHRGIRS